MCRPSTVVIVGPDCAGKTSVISELYDRLGCRIDKNVHIHDEYSRLLSVIRDIEDARVRTSGLSGRSPMVLMDRWHLVDDVVYGPICHGQDTVFDGCIFSLLINQASDLGFMIVYLNIDASEMINRFRARGDLERSEEEILAVKDAYERFFHGECAATCGTKLDNHIPILEVDVTGKTTKEIADEIMAAIGGVGEC